MEEISNHLYDSNPPGAEATVTVSPFPAQPGVLINAGSAFAVK